MSARSLTAAPPMHAAPNSPAAARPRIGLICDFVEENWPSMDLVARMVFEHLQLEHSGALDVTRICPPLHSRLARLANSSALRNADRLLNRFYDYPRALAPLASDCDLFHLIDHSYSQLLHRLPAGRVVVTCHDLDTFRSVLEPERDPRPAWFRAMAARVLSGFRKAAHVIAVSAATRDEILRLGLHPADRVTVVSNGVDPAYSPTPDPAADAALDNLLGAAPPDTLWLLNVGSAMPRKRLDVLLAVTAKVREHTRNVRLLRVGEPLTSDQRRLALELGIDDTLTELGFLDRPTLGAAYRRAAALVHTAEAEGFGLTLIEAMASGCPVIASDISVLREVGGSAADLCPVADLSAWTSTVIRTLAAGQDPIALNRIRQAGFTNAARFSWLRNVGQTADIYIQTLEKNN